MIYFLMYYLIGLVIVLLHGLSYQDLTVGDVVPALILTLIWPLAGLPVIYGWLEDHAHIVLIKKFGSRRE